MADPEIIDIDPSGDVVFVCTAEDGHSVRIRVLSVFVTTASPVLKAMLGPKFKEGNTLASTSSVEVALPDDDPFAMELIFRAMHMRISSLPSTLDISSVKQLAYAVDKYDCAGPLAPMAFYWIQSQLLADKYDLVELYDLLHVTYLLDQYELFGQVGSRLILETSSPIQGGQGILVPTYNALERQRVRTFLSTSRFLEGQMAKAIERFDSCSDGCSYRYQYPSKFLSTLKRWKLWSLDPEQLQLSGVLQALRDISFHAIDKDCSTHKYACGSSSVNSEAIAETFGAWARKAEQNLLPLCLKCVKGGELPQECAHGDKTQAFGT